MFKNSFFKNRGPFSISEIIKKCNLNLSVRNNNIKIYDVRNLNESRDSDITFFHSIKYKDQAKLTNAKYCITTESLIKYLPESCKSIKVENGFQGREFEIIASDYDENRHFFLGQYFHENYDEALGNLPIISSGINISRIEVWVTNKTGETENIRNIIGFMDLGEKETNNET